jgi:hypothetical protein
VPQQGLAHGAKLALHALATRALAQVGKDQFAQRRAGNVGVELPVHEGVQMEATGEAVSAQGRKPAGE